MQIIMHIRILYSTFFARLCFAFFFTKATFRLLYFFCYTVKNFLIRLINFEKCISGAGNNQFIFTKERYHLFCF